MENWYDLSLASQYHDSTVKVGIRLIVAPATKNATTKTILKPFM